MRFSVTQSGTNHFTYTGIFDDGDGVSFAVSGHVALFGNSLVGSFNGAKTTSTNFKTATYRVVFDQALGGSAEGIRQVYVRGDPTSTVNNDYRTHTLTPASCP